jgi:hypothetical protein
VKLLREKAPTDSASFRVFTMREVFDPTTPAPPELRRLSDWILWTEPDVYMMYGIQNAAGYDGFALDRYSRLAGQMKLWGELTDADATLRGGSRELDLLNTRYLLSRRKNSEGLEMDSSAGASSVAPASPYPAATDKFGGFMFAPGDLALPNIGANKRLRFTLPSITADHLALITNLSWAEDVPDNEPVAHVRLKAKDGRVFEFKLRAGADTADWAFDRQDIRARIRYKRPPVAASYDVDAQNKYQGHTYVTDFALPEKTTIESGEIMLEPVAQAPDLLLTVFRLSVVDASAGKTYPVSRDLVRIESPSEKTGTSQPGDQESDRWHLVAQGRTVDIYENARALPRAWLVSEARVLDEDAMLQTIRTGLLPDGSKWDPRRTALVEKDSPNALPDSGPEGRVEITKYEPNRVNLQTHSSGNSILVLSENDYPGWRVYVDGKSTEVLRVNYALRGVMVPSGDHQVSFSYRPWSVMSGFLISLITAAGLIILSRRTRLSVLGAVLKMF